MSRRWHLPKSMGLAAIKLADADLRAKHVRGEFDEGDPNHPKYNSGYNYTRPLFGMRIRDFLAQQY